MSFTASLDEIVAENFNGLLSKAPHWSRQKLSDLASIKNGAPLPSSGFNTLVGTPVVRIRNVLDGATETLFDGPVEDSWFIEHGDLLIGMDGDFNAARWKGPRALLNQRVCMVCPTDGRVSVQYLSFVLPGYLAAVNKHTPSITVKHLSSRTVSDLPIPVPPPAEQCTLVAAIETHFSRLDAAVASLTRAKANVKRARASVLKAAVEGRLVPTEAALARADGRDYEPASVLLERILAERKAAWAASGVRGKYKEPVAPETDGSPGLPEGWRWTTLGQAFAVEVGATPSRQRPHYWGGEIAWVSSGEVQFCRIKQTRETITSEGLENTSTKVHPRGTVLLGMIGQGRTRGQAAILDIEACNNQNCAAIRVSESGCVPEYVYGWLELQYDETRRLGGGNNQQALNKARVEAIAFPLPPLAEQQRIVVEVDRRLSVLDSLDATLDANLARCARLRQAVLKRAFEGRLVPAEAPANDGPRLVATPQTISFAQDTCV